MIEFSQIVNLHPLHQLSFLHIYYYPPNKPSHFKIKNNQQLYIDNPMQLASVILPILLLLALVPPTEGVLPSTHAKYPAECKKTYYDYMVLTLTQPAQYCNQNTCNKSWRDLVGGLPLTVHGLWPVSTDLSYLTCVIEKGFDPYCRRNYNFNITVFTAAEKAKLNKYWPNLSTGKNFWSYEWDKHGTCYLYILKEEQKSPLSDAQILRQYFLGAVDKVEKLNPRLRPGTYKTKVELANELGLHASEFYAICDRDNEVDEIRVCYNITIPPGDEDIITCPPSTDRTHCKFPVVVLK